MDGGEFLYVFLLLKIICVWSVLCGVFGIVGDDGVCVSGFPVDERF